MRVAAFQRVPCFDDPERAVVSVLRALGWANGQGVGLAVFPESYLQGHSYDQPDVERRALSVDASVIQALVAGTSSLPTTAIVGFFERRGDDVFNSAMVIETGRIVGVYAKNCPIEEGCTPGDARPVFRRQTWTYGINICNDLNDPMVAQSMVSSGARLICSPLNMMLRPKKADLWRRPALASLQACARRTGCWVVSSDVAGHRGDGWLSYGCTAIVSPHGDVVARAAELVDDVVCFDLPEPSSGSAGPKRGPRRACSVSRPGRWREIGL